MDIKVQEQGKYLVVSPSGRLDATSAQGFEAEMSKLAAGGSNFIIMDMAGLEYISSAGLRSVLLLAKTVRAAKGELRFAAFQPPVAEVFSISGFSSMFAIFPSLAEALEK